VRTVKTAAPAPNGSVAGLLGEAAVAITVGLGEGGRSLGEDLGECLEDFFVIGASKVGKVQERSEKASILKMAVPKFVEFDGVNGCDNPGVPELVVTAHVCTPARCLGCRVINIDCEWICVGPR
jgi:hypothetical protein